MALSVQSPATQATTDGAARRRTQPPSSTRPDAVEDQELADIVAAAAAGDQRAWVHLTKRFNNMILAIARSCRLADADVGEVSQTAWLRLVENIDRIEQPGRIGAWLATTARRESLRIVRAKARIAFDFESFERVADLNSPGLDAGVLAEERSDAMREAYAKLPPRCQRLLGLLSGSDPPSYKEVSEILSMPIGSIGPTRGRCLEHLRRILLGISAEP
jgi:RNA polymerase sigma factor (sigma-70 family)